MFAEWRDLMAQAEIASDLGAIIALVGGPGTGKTQLAVELMKRAAKKVKTCRYARGVEIASAVRATFNTKGDETEAVSRFTKPYLLVVDEFHDRSFSEFEQRLLNLILDKRYASLKPTILISNGTPEELREQVGERVIDRMREHGRILHFTFGSFRGLPAVDAAREEQRDVD